MTTAEFVPNCTAGQLVKSLMKVVYTYACGGFIVNLALLDMESKTINNKMTLVEVNTMVAAREHVPDIERQIRTVKEHTRCAKCDFPFDPIPKMAIIHVTAIG